MSQEELIYLHALRSLPSFGDKSLRKVLVVFGTPQAAWEATSYPTSLDLSPKIKDSYLARHTHIPNPEKHFSLLRKEVFLSSLLMTQSIPHSS